MGFGGARSTWCYCLQNQGQCTAFRSPVKVFFFGLHTWGASIIRPSFLMLYYLGNLDIEQDLQDLTKEEIIVAGRPILFGKADGRARKHLLETVALLNTMDQLRIHTAAVHKRKSNAMGYPSKRQQRSEADPPNCQQGSYSGESQVDYEDSEFFRSLLQSVVQECISKFIDRTGNAALAMAVCMVCARSMVLSKTHEVTVSLIPIGHLLAPHKQHPAHRLIAEMLLEPTAIRNDNGVQKGGFLFLPFFLA